MGASAAYLAQITNRAAGFPFDIGAILDLDGGPWGGGLSLGTASVLRLTSRQNSLSALEIWEGNPTLGRVTEVAYSVFNHIYLNSRWVAFAENPRYCPDYVENTEYGPLTPEVIPALHDWAKCYSTAFLGAEFLGQNSWLSYLSGGMVPSIPNSDAPTIRWLISNPAAQL